MVKPIGRASIPPDSLAAMRRRGGLWAAYQIQDERSRLYRQLRFLQYGSRDNTFRTPPESYLKYYKHVGYVDLEDGCVRIVAQPRASRYEGDK